MFWSHFYVTLQAGKNIQKTMLLQRLKCCAILLLVLLVPAFAQATEEGSSFYTLTQQDGLSSNCVLQMLQLHDGRMVMVTDKAVDVYDGQRFSSVPIDTTRWQQINRHFSTFVQTESSFVLPY